MPQLIAAPTRIPVPGGKIIDEYVGQVTTGTARGLGRADDGAGGLGRAGADAGLRRDHASCCAGRCGSSTTAACSRCRRVRP